MCIYVTIKVNNFFFFWVFCVISLGLVFLLFFTTNLLKNHFTIFVLLFKLYLSFFGLCFRCLCNVENPVPLRVWFFSLVRKRCSLCFSSITASAYPRFHFCFSVFFHGEAQSHRSICDFLVGLSPD